MYEIERIITTAPFHFIVTFGKKSNMDGDFNEIQEDRISNDEQCKLTNREIIKLYEMLESALDELDEIYEEFDLFVEELMNLDDDQLLFI